MGPGGGGVREGCFSGSVCHQDQNPAYAFLMRPLRTTDLSTLEIVSK